MIHKPFAAELVSQWCVHYPWETQAMFHSSNPMLNRVWQMCADTIKYTSLDTFTDSNTREREPYEANGLVLKELTKVLKELYVTWLKYIDS